MKQRILSGAIIALITALAVIIGGYFLQAICIFVGIYSAYEVVNCVKHKFDLFLYLVCALTTLGLYFFFDKALSIIIVEILVLFTISVFDEFRSLDDIAVIFLMSILIGLSIYFLNHIENISKWLLGYVIIISYITDVFALFVGMKFGKHKLNERVSPKKSIEGAIGGFVFGALISFIYAYLFDFFGFDMYVILISSLTLPIVSQIGDLAYSLIKRHYKIKDFSKLIPGHGGILDRLDSLTFCVCLLGAILMFIG